MAKPKRKKEKARRVQRIPSPEQSSVVSFSQQGTCNRDDSCPFSQDVVDGEPVPKGKAQTKATAAPKAKTAAAVAFASLPSASALSESNMTALLRACTAPLQYFAHIFACVVPVLHSSVSHTQESESAASSSFCVNWIADSGAGRSFGNDSSLEAGGIPSGLIKDNTTTTEYPIDFATGGGQGSMASGPLREQESSQTIVMSMIGYAEQFVQLFLDITGCDPKSLRKVATVTLHINDSRLAGAFYALGTGSYGVVWCAQHEEYAVKEILCKTQAELRNALFEGYLLKRLGETGREGEAMVSPFLASRIPRIAAQETENMGQAQIS
eukprot:s2424_g5.t1